MDFVGIPTSQIAKHFDVTCTCINQWRQKELYKDTIAFLKADRMERTAKLISTSDLRKLINTAMEIGVNRVIEILSNKKSPYKDVIAAARLAAALDGRFLKGSLDEDKPGSYTANEPLAEELIRAIKERRKDGEKETVQ